MPFRRSNDPPVMSAVKIESRPRNLAMTSSTSDTCEEIAGERNRLAYCAVSIFGGRVQNPKISEMYRAFVAIILCDLTRGPLLFGVAGT